MAAYMIRAVLAETDEERANERNAERLAAEAKAAGYPVKSVASAGFVEAVADYRTRGRLVAIVIADHFEQAAAVAMLSGTIFTSPAESLQVTPWSGSHEDVRAMLAAAR